MEKIGQTIPKNPKITLRFRRIRVRTSHQRAQCPSPRSRERRLLPKGPAAFEPGIVAARVLIPHDPSTANRGAEPSVNRGCPCPLRISRLR